MTPDQEIIEVLVHNHGLLSFINSEIPQAKQILLNNLEKLYQLYWAFCAWTQNLVSMQEKQNASNRPVDPHSFPEWHENVEISDKIISICSSLFGEDIIKKAYGDKK